MSLNYPEAGVIATTPAAQRKTARQDEASADIRNPLLLAIEEAAAKEDRAAISRLAKFADWKTQGPDDLIRVIQASLSLDMVLLARELAYEGRHLFPSDKRIEQWATVLAPARVVGTRPASGNAAGLRATQFWFEQNSAHYKGQWVAVREGKLIGAALKLKELHEQIGREQRNASTIIVKVLP